MSSHGLAGEELTKRPLNARTSKQNGNCNAKTKAFWDIVDANRAPEEGELADVFDKLGNPDAVTLSDIRRAAASGDFYDWLSERKNRRAIPFRLDRCGYKAVANPDREDHLWSIGGERQTVYAKAGLPLRDQIRAARDRANKPKG